MRAARPVRAGPLWVRRSPGAALARSLDRRDRHLDGGVLLAVPLGVEALGLEGGNDALSRAVAVVEVDRDVGPVRVEVVARQDRLAAVLGPPERPAPPPALPARTSVV